MINLEKIKSEKPIKELLKFSIINIDKPSGPTSFQVSQFIKNTLNINKTSHMGTLDPQVSGVLPVALSRACRLSEYLMHKDKTYIGIMRLHKDIEDKKLIDAINKFIGKITQLPPIRSRVKRAERVREIKFFRILERDGKNILFETQVQAGTYIRKLVHDMGKNIGGAHMLELRRTKAGFFEEIDSINLYDFEKAINEYKNGDEKNLRKIIIPAEVIANFLPFLEIHEQTVKKCLTGSPIFKNFVKNIENIKGLKKYDKLCIFSDNNFIGCYKFISEGDIIALPEFVFN
ncbi:MAG: RNA-guided pseudouridylation complex pseudouridine synthase subunit Cbf5 [Nanoarchaeota archaeon]